MTIKKLTKRKIQAINTKNQILETALKLVIKYGYDNVSVNQICEEAGVSTGAFYHHFNAKEGIIIETYKQVDEYFQDYVMANLENMNTIDKIIEFIIYQVKYACDLGIDIMTHLYKTQLYAGNDFFISEERTLPKELRNIIKEGQENNELRNDISDKDIERRILRFSRGLIYDWCLRNGKYDLVKETRDAMNYFLQAFTTKRIDTTD